MEPGYPSGTAINHKTPPNFTIIRIPHDWNKNQENQDLELNVVLEKSRNFRLLSLRESPSSFGSTYEREVVFTGEQWLQRLQNPKVETFVAVDINERVDGNDLNKNSSQSGNIAQTLLTRRAWLGSAVLVRGQQAATQKEPLKELVGRKPRLDFQINGLYVIDGARKRGLGGKLVEEVIKFAEAEAAHRSKNGSPESDAVKAKAEVEAEVSSVAWADNENVQRLWARHGFSAAERSVVKAHSGTKEAVTWRKVLMSR